mmetsp:Transcript_15563/g.44935  ORF Transcript_15563/g.44935 Transcript_15563/m.44935 type:complete len:239 (-) Transcript_15563:769-1485(-)
MAGIVPRRGAGGRLRDLQHRMLEARLQAVDGLERLGIGSGGGRGRGGPRGGRRPWHADLGGLRAQCRARLRGAEAACRGAVGLLSNCFRRLGPGGRPGGQRTAIRRVLRRVPVSPQRAEALRLLVPRRRDRAAEGVGQAVGPEAQAAPAAAEGPAAGLRGGRGGRGRGGRRRGRRGGEAARALAARGGLPSEIRRLLPPALRQPSAGVAGHRPERHRRASEAGIPQGGCGDRLRGRPN